MLEAGPGTGHYSLRRTGRPDLIDVQQTVLDSRRARRDGHSDGLVRLAHPW